MAMTTSELRRELEELIAALERRVPHIERAGEAAIARDAEALRQEALRRIAELDDERLRASADADNPRQ
jgi:4-hydroxy-3-methylbut-2-enyl diphosphate reductase IspH